MSDEEKSDRKWRGFWKDRHDGTRPEMVVSMHHVTEKGTDIVSTPTKGGRNSALLLFARRSSVVRFVHDAVTVRSGAYTSYTENYFR